MPASGGRYSDPMSRPEALTVVVALSGGVDSAVAAARVVEVGHEVIGVHLSLGEMEKSSPGRGCRSPEDVDDASRVAQRLGIPFEVWDLEEEFERIIVDEFVAGYAAGLTPNPCVTCNRRIKFESILDRGEVRGFDAVVTGHYARVTRPGREAPVELHRARDLVKDQSYVVAALGSARLERAMFPLGEVGSKTEVRAEAVARGLSVHDRPESQDVCFIPHGDLTRFLSERLGESPGEILDEEGRVVGEHRGAYSFTIGQRKGLRISNPASDGEPRYVLKVHPETNTVVVGPRVSLDVSFLTGTGVVWLAEDVPAADPTPCSVQVRAHGEPALGKVTVTGDTLRVDLERSMARVAAGQAIVVYDGTRVLGQATAVND